jgi:anti-sigma-K factor RskA
MTSRHEEMRELSGAYVLDALADDERDAFEDHLADCALCQAEVRDLRETITGVAATYETAAPAGAEARLMRAVAAEKPTPRSPSATSEVVPISKVRRLRRTNYLLAAASVVLAMALAGVGVAAYSAQQHLNQDKAAMAVAMQPDAHLMPLPIPSASSAIVVSMAQNSASVLATSMPMPASDHVYQVWSKTADGTMNSLGMFVPNRNGHVAAMLTGDITATKEFVITVEPAGGSSQPTEPPIATVAV